MIFITYLQFLFHAFRVNQKKACISYVDHNNFSNAAVDKPAGKTFSTLNVNTGFRINLYSPKKYQMEIKR